MSLLSSDPTDLGLHFAYTGSDGRDLGSCLENELRMKVEVTEAMVAALWGSNVYWTCHAMGYIHQSTASAIQFIAPSCSIL